MAATFLQLLSARDHQYVRDFTNLPYAGFANTHSLTLDLGAWTPQNPLRLFLHGFIEYFSATSMYAAWQAGLQPISPYIEAQMPDGSWKRVVDDMGFPAGLPRTITVDLTGKLPPGTRRIRITTNLQIYWDQVLVDNGPAARERSTHHRVAAGGGDSGIPRLSAASGRRDSRRPHLLLRQASTTGPFSRFRGSYTHYGDVTSLLPACGQPFRSLRHGRRHRRRIQRRFAASAAARLDARLFLLRQRLRKGHGFLRSDSVHRRRHAVSRNAAYPYPAAQHYPDDCSGDRVSPRLERPLSNRGASKAPDYRLPIPSREPSIRSR